MIKVRKPKSGILNIGERYGRLVVISDFGLGKFNRHLWTCSCDCGGSRVVATHHLRSGEVRSCGCLLSDSARQRFTKHGMSNSPEYNSWKAMRARCYNRKRAEYQNYGARGIRVCDEWRNSFSRFLADVGRKPSAEHTLERIDNNANYQPGNVQWATRGEQVRNRRNNIQITINGVTRCLRDWATLLGVPYSTAFYRHQRGEPIA